MNSLIPTYSLRSLARVDHQAFASTSRKPALARTRLERRTPACHPEHIRFAEFTLSEANVLRMTLGSRFVSPNLEQYVGINAMAQTMEVVVILSLS